MECSILLHFYVDKRETHKLEFWIIGFFSLKLDNFWEILHGSRDCVGDESKRERERNTPKSNRRKVSD